MIAVSDAVLIALSVAVLGAGLYRWQDKVEQASLARQTTTTVSQQASQSAGGNASDNQGDSNIGSSNTIGAVEPTTDNADQRDIAQTTANQTNTNQSGQEPVVAENITDSSNEVSVSEPETSSDSSTDSTEDILASATYVVEEGDSLSRIANRFNTSVSTLQQLNNIQGTLIRVGQTLRYPLPAN